MASIPPIKGAVAIVTGASSGIGLELAKLLADEVSVLVIVARRQRRLLELAAELKEERSELKVAPMPIDLAVEGAAEELFQSVIQTHGRIDILVNCAGLGDISLCEHADLPKLQTMVAVNVGALMALTHLALPSMVARGSGGILNISSGLGVTSLPAVAAYAGTKHFVSGFSEALAMELHGTGVVVTQVLPGPVATEFERIAGNPTGMAVPGFLEISAEECARSSLRAFSKGRKRVTPGFYAAILIFAGAWAPHWLLRLLYRSLGGALRRKVNSGVR